jgi:hypothetical protein
MGSFESHCVIDGVRAEMDRLDFRGYRANIEGMTGAQEFIRGLPPHLFWDVDRSSIDPQEHAAFLICRVMERGTSQEVRRVWNFYGEAEVREALINAPSLTRKTIAFFANQFRIPREAFRAYQRGQNWTQ